MLLLAAAFVAIGCLTLALAPSLLIANWIPLATAEQQGKLIGEAARVVLFGLGGIIAAIGVAVSVSRHFEELDSARRDRTRLLDEQARDVERVNTNALQHEMEIERELRSRFTSAVGLLSDIHSPIKRIAGLYGLSTLSDDWNAIKRFDEVQICINVITDYLRAPFSPDHASTPDDEVLVRTTGFRILHDHLIPDSTNTWSNHILNLAGAVIDFYVNLERIVLSGKGKLILRHCIIRGNGRLDLRTIRVKNDAAVDFYDATVLDNGHINLYEANISDNASLTLVRTQIADKCSVTLFGAEVNQGGIIDLERVSIDGTGSIQLRSLKVNDHGRVNLAQTETTKINLNGLHVSPHGSIIMTDKTQLSERQL